MYNRVAVVDTILQMIFVVAILVSVSHNTFPQAIVWGIFLIVAYLDEVINTIRYK